MDDGDLWRWWWCWCWWLGWCWCWWWWAGWLPRPWPLITSATSGTLTPTMLPIMTLLFLFSPKPPSRMLQDLPKLSFPINYQSGFSCLSRRFYLGRNHNSFGKNTLFLSLSPSFSNLKKPVFPIIVHITKECIALVDLKHKQSFNMSTNHVLHWKKSSSSELHPSCAPAISNELFCGAHCAPFSSPCVKRAGWISTFNS